MIDYRYHLTALVAVFLALGLGMLIGITLIGSPSPESQMQQLLSLQRDFEDFRQQHEELRENSDDMKARLGRADNAYREILPAYSGSRLAGKRIALVLTGEIEDTGFLGDLNQTLEDAGAEVISTTRMADDWLPSDPEDHGRVMAALGVTDGAAPHSTVAAAVGRAIANGRSAAILAAARAASGLRLDGNYARSADGVVIISGTTTEERLDQAKAGLTPEAGLLAGLRETSARVVVAETDGPEALSTIPLWTRDAAATVDNIDMASGQFSTVWALAGSDGRYGLKSAAERPIPDLKLR